MTICDYLETKLMDATTNAASYSNNALWVKLHISNPGETATSGAAAETTRKQATAAASSGGVFTSTNDLIWTNVAGTETISHVSVWDASTNGNALYYGALGASKAVNAGDTFTISAGSLTLTLD